MEKKKVVLNEKQNPCEEHREEERELTLEDLEQVNGGRITVSQNFIYC